MPMLSVLQQGHDYSTGDELNIDGPHTPPGQVQNGDQYVQTAPQGVWQFKPKASPLRISAGVVGLVLSVVGILFSGILLFGRNGGSSTPLNGWMILFVIVGSIGSLVTGIVILAKQRKRGGATPWLVLSFAALVVVACLSFMATRDIGLPGAPPMIMPFALATAVLAGLVILMEKLRR